MNLRLTKFRDPAIRSTLLRTSTQRFRASLHGYSGARVSRGVRLRGAGTYELRPGSQVRRDAQVWVGPGATLSLEKGANIGIRNIVNVETGLVIGTRTEISWDVQIMDTDFHTISDGLGKMKIKTAPIHIGAHVLIGAGAMILKGVTIGDGAVIAARAVVTRDVSAGTIVGGNPAKVLGTISDWK